MNFEINGIHHVTAITSSAEKIYRFFTDILGLRLIKKTVNQDDIQTYHLYFTDDQGTVGTTMTFFDFIGIPKGTKGTNTISRTGFRVKTDAALKYWIDRFNDYGIIHGEIQERFGNKFVDFEDFDQQQYQIISDENSQDKKAGVPWKNANVPAEYGIIGLGPVYVSVRNFEQLQTNLVDLLGFTLKEAEGNFHLFEIGAGGNSNSLIVEHNVELPDAIEGYGNVHHLALRVNDKQSLEHWIKKINKKQLPSSGFVERYYFSSEYFRPASQLLFELATDGPGFLTDETYEKAGEKLALPPFLETKRSMIENYVRPFNTKDANQKRNS